MKKLLSVILLSIILAGCNSAFNEYIEKGDKALSSSDLNEALTNYELALDEQPDNEEVQGKIDFLKDVIQLFELIAEKNWEEASEIIKPVLNNEYISEVDSLHADVEEMQQIVDDKLENDGNVRSAIDKITNLLENEQIDDAVKEIEKLKQEHIVVSFSKELEDIEKEIEKQKNIITDNERKQEVDDQKDESPKSEDDDELYPNADYMAMAKSKQNQDDTVDSDNGLVYKMQIKDNKLIVWGSLQAFNQGSDEPTYLEDKKRTFTLADDVNLGLEWVGNKEEQIQYFNEKGTNLNASAVSVRTVNDEVIAVGFAG